MTEPVPHWVWPDTLIAILAVLLIAVIAHIVVIALVKRALKRARDIATQPEGTLARKAASAFNNGSKSGRTMIRVTALAHLARSIWTFLIVIVSLVTIMYFLGIPLSPLMASAGIGGIVLAFGAQSLIKDYLSGISMIIEDQYGVGDQINVGAVTGTVENITLRITKLRDANGMIWYVRNGEILRVGNISQGYSVGLIDVPVAYDADINRVVEVLGEVVDEVAQDESVAEHLLEPPELLGVESITATTLTMRIRIKTPPNEQLALARDIRERAMSALSAAGVPGPSLLPFPTE